MCIRDSYKDNTIKEDTSVKAALMYCIDKFYPEYNIHDIIGSKEVQAYKSAAEIMKSGMAERHWKSFSDTDDFNPGKFIQTLFILENC